MSLGFSQLIQEIEAELALKYQGGAITWADENFDGAWTKAMERFDKALSLAIERQDYRTAELEGGYYKATVLDLLAKYKRAKKIDNTDSFLKSL